MRGLTPISSSSRRSWVVSFQPSSRFGPRSCCIVRTSTPSTRRLLDGVALRILTGRWPRRSTPRPKTRLSGEAGHARL